MHSRRPACAEPPNDVSTRGLAACLAFCCRLARVLKPRHRRCAGLVGCWSRADEELANDSTLVAGTSGLKLHTLGQPLGRPGAKSSTSWADGF